MGLFSAIVKACDEYNEWYDRVMVPANERDGQPKCKFCGQKNYAVGAESYTNSRYLPTRVAATFACRTCGMRYRALRAPHSRHWTFDESL